MFSFQNTRECRQKSEVKGKNIGLQKGNTPFKNLHSTEQVTISKYVLITTFKNIYLKML